MTELEQLAGRIEALQRRLALAPSPTDAPELLAAESLRVEIGALLDQLAEVAADARLGALARRLAGIAHDESTATRAQFALAAVCEAVAATRGFLVVFAADGDEARVLAAEPSDGALSERRAPSRALLREVLEGRRAVRVTDAGESRFSKETSVISLALRSILAAPLLVGERVWGAVYLESDRGCPLEAAEQDLLEHTTGFISALVAPTAGAHPAAIPNPESTEAGEIVGRSPAIRRLLGFVARLAASDVPVLIEGESGTGKELVARALHSSGPRAAQPFVAINCAAMPEGLIESELFGHERGAFTGAVERRAGRFEAAHLGTLFLDEVGEIRYDLQAKLLRVLQERSFSPVGGGRTVYVDVRLVAASNRNLRQLVAAGSFREDLFYRLAVVPIEVPPLRDRPEDVPALVRHFLADINGRIGRQVEIEPDVIAALERYPFPGNVRELRNLVERLVTLADGDRVLGPDLPTYVLGESALTMDKDPFRRFLREPPLSNADLKRARLAMEELLGRYVRRLEAGFVRSLLARAKGKVSEAARLSGMNRTLFHRKLREAELMADDDG